MECEVFAWCGCRECDGTLPCRFDNRRDKLLNDHWAALDDKTKKGLLNGRGEV